MENGEPAPAVGSRRQGPQDGIWQLIGATDAAGTPMVGHLYHAVDEDPTLVDVLDLLSGPNGRHLLASGSYDETIRLWDPANGNQIGPPLTSHIGEVYALTALPDPSGRTLLASISGSGTIRLWDPSSGQQVGPPGPTGWANAMAVLPGPDARTLLAGASYDNTIRLWDPSSGQEIGPP